MTEFTGKTVIVTGGASGIGRGIVERFARAGASVFIADVDEDKGANLAESLGTETAWFVKTDVADTQQISDCISTVHATSGRVDCLINNAGIADTSTLENLAEEKAMFFLASSNAGWVTGQNLVVDGGYTSMSLESTAS